MANKNKTLKKYNKQKTYGGGVGLVNESPYNRNLTYSTDEISGVKKDDTIKFTIQFYKSNKSPNITYTNILFNKDANSVLELAYIDNKWNKEHHNNAYISCTVVCIMKVVQNQNGGKPQSNLSFILDKIESININRKNPNIKNPNRKVKPIEITNEQILNEVKKTLTTKPLTDTITVDDKSSSSTHLTTDSTRKALITFDIHPLTDILAFIIITFDNDKFDSVKLQKYLKQFYADPQGLNANNSVKVKSTQLDPQQQDHLNNDDFFQSLKLFKQTREKTRLKNQKAEEAEEARKAKEAEESRKAKEAEESRKAKEAEEAEAKRIAEAAKSAKAEARKAAEARIAEESRKAAEARIAEESAKAEARIAKAAEAKRIAAEAKRIAAEAKRIAAEAEAAKAAEYSGQEDEFSTPVDE